MPNSELDEIKRIAQAAGAILLHHYANPTAVEWKGPGDPVTQADRAASALIVDELRRLFPDDGILSEEIPDDSIRLDRQRVWMIDPMDGTREFIAQREEFAVMIGLVDSGVPVLGVVFQPTADKLYYAAAGAGAAMDQRGATTPLQVSSEDAAANMILAVSRSHRSARVDRLRERLSIPDSIQSGSVGLKVGLICEGRAHLYVHMGPQTNIWDTCGPEAILREAGGRMTDAAGNPLRYTDPEVKNLHGIIASNGTIHDRAIRASCSMT
jgi:3'(2'), 5'-bisphosphate nucleotidase